LDTTGQCVEEVNDLGVLLNILSHATTITTTTTATHPITQYYIETTSKIKQVQVIPFTDLDHAEAEFLDELKLKESELDSLTHPGLLSTLLGLLKLYQIGFKDEPEVYKKKMEEVMKKMSQVYQQHPEECRQLDLFQPVGESMIFCGEYSQAKSLFHDALAQAKLKFGEVSLEVAKKMHYLGLTMLKTSQPTEGMHQLVEALAIRRHLLPSHHPEIAEILSDLGAYLLGMGEISKGAEATQEALQIRRAAWGEEHPLVVLSLTNLGLSYQVQKEAEKALKCYQESLALGRRVYGEVHPILALSLMNIGNIYDDTERPDEALKCYEEAAEVTRKTLGKDSRQYSICLNNLGTWCVRRQAFDRALKYHEEALMVCLKVAPESRETVETYRALGTTYANMEKWEQAREVLEKAWSMGQRVMDSKDIALAYVLLCLSGACQELGQEAMALVHQQKAYAIIAANQKSR
jgi:tetratricopeptide (TPR) repeat protein